jgi:hypothetical protein
LPLLTILFIGSSCSSEQTSSRGQSSSEFIAAIGEPLEVESSGTWARVFWTEDGWIVGTGAQHGFFVAGLRKTGDGLEDWKADQRELVTDRDDLRINDYGIAQCPDGGFVLGASYDQAQPNDSAYYWTFSSGFDIQTSGFIEQGSNLRQYNDMAVLCSEASQGIGASIQGYDFGNHFFPFDNGIPQEPFQIEEYPRLNGGGLFADGNGIYAIGMDYNRPFHVNRYDEEWVLQESNEVELLSEPYRSYWSQAGMRVGDHFLAVMMGRSSDWMQGDKGDVYLAVFDSDWGLAELARLTQYEENIAMRPWMSRHGSQLLVSFDANQEHMILEVELDLDGLGAD